MEQEFADRYGPVPDEVRQLLTYSRDQDSGGEDRD